MSNTFQSFSTTHTIPEFNTDFFLESSSVVAKFIFLILALLIFFILLRIIVSIIAWALKPSTSPHIINGMINANQMLIIQQDPTLNGSINIPRSTNAEDGIEFTWSVWIYINTLQTNNDKYRHIFHKGNANFDNEGMNQPNNAPGLYIKPNTNTLVVVMNTYEHIDQEVEVPDIPLNKWVNVIIRCQDTTLDIYINGTIARSITLQGVPKQNYGDVYIAMNGGFDGYISNLWYYNYGLGTTAIQSLANNGPNTNISNTSDISIKDANYLALRWYI